MNAENPAPTAAKQPDSPWQYKPAANAPDPAPVTPSPAAAMPASAPLEVSWTASEFVDHDKGISWYAALAGITLFIDVVLFFWTHDFISITAVTIMAILFGIMAGRKPRVLEYRLDAAGLSIGSAFHSYAEFKSFAVMDDGAFSTIMFSPLKRFMPPVGVYYGPDDQERIMAVLAQYLPMEAREHDIVDRFSRRIRF